MIKIKIEMFPALNGDSFLVTLLGRKTTRILIDMGYAETYSTFIKDCLDKIEGDFKKIDLIVFSHIHQDHIAGGIKFLDENSKKKYIEIGEVWHNGYKHIPGFNSLKSNFLSFEDKRLLQNILLENKPKVHFSLSNSVSANQSLDLEDLIPVDKWNSSFEGNAVCIDYKNEINLNTEVKLKLLAPNKNDLSNLNNVFDIALKKQYKQMKTKDRIFAKLFERILQHELTNKSNWIDRPISAINKSLEEYLNGDAEEDIGDFVNRSSISFVIEFYNKKFLFLGDSYSSQIRNQLLKLYPLDINSMIYFDAIKIAHHGSKNNTSKKLLDLIDSNRFFISTNGDGHDHPDIETLSRIVCRKTTTIRELFFNYETETCKVLNNIKWMERHKYVINLMESEVVFGEEVLR
ncbi:MBL fold metallo-hydrolase [Clostridium estertheticum]|uniref:MBL fold metallo-hydrolase n=1 Tax=Clostridium estertheticum TaxID=238834 RepID=UPI001C7CB487|nr:MBL fold metallo-hydrolase [Clostridium estertheticum]MBX4261941.1 MBL fold metallo-hydrolase [Clostridium estertheticum]WLC68629.1 MBL fold metallo-hydrolase [Clostridium estertheticum]